MCVICVDILKGDITYRQALMIFKEKLATTSDWDEAIHYKDLIDTIEQDLKKGKEKV